MRGFGGVRNTFSITWIVDSGSFGLFVRVLAFALIRLAGLVMISFPEHEFIGVVTTAWNEIDHAWHQIYLELMRDTTTDKANAIYRTLITGSAQRELTLNIAAVALSKHPDLLKELKDLSTQTSNLLGRRNAVVHARLGISVMGKVEVGVIKSDAYGKPNRLSGKPLKPELLKLAREIGKLHQSLWAFTRKLAASL